MATGRMYGDLHKKIKAVAEGRRIQSKNMIPDKHNNLLYDNGKILER